MSGDGVISARLPRSLLGVFRSAAEREGISIHEAARRLLSSLPSLTQDDFLSLREPPRELDNPRISLHVGWDVVDVLTEVSLGSRLLNSNVIRRLLFGFLIDKTVQFVQRGERWELQLISQEMAIENNGDNETHAAR